MNYLEDGEHDKDKQIGLQGASYPAHVCAVQVLPREYSDSVEVLVDQLKHLVVKGGRLGAGHCLWARHFSTSEEKERLKQSNKGTKERLLQRKTRTRGTTSPARRRRASWLLTHLDLLPSARLLLLSYEPLAAGDRHYMRPRCYSDQGPTYTSPATRGA